MEDHTISIVSLLVSVAAFVFGAYSLWLTRKDRGFKHQVLQDNVIAQPLLQYDVVRQLIAKDEDLRFICFDIAVEMSTMGVVFKNNEFNQQFYGLIRRMMHLSREHPDRYPNMKEVNGQYVEGKNPDHRMVYYNDIDEWVMDWKEFKRELKIYLALKDS